VPAGAVPAGAVPAGAVPAAVVAGGTGAWVTAGPAAGARCLSCGSHSTAASAAGTAHTPSASRTEPPELRYSGTLSSEERIAPTDSAVR